MNVNDLNKSQFLLLTLLVNFITSIATGILTVSLLEKAPPTITQTINRVVERTIETVTETEGKAATVITRETTVVVKDEDILTSAIAAHEKRLVVIYAGATSTPALAHGLLVSGESLIIAPSVGGTNLIMMHTNSGEVFPISRVAEDTKNTITLYAITLPEDKNLQGGNYVFADSKNIKPGQTAVALPLGGGVVTGIVSRQLQNGSIETTISGEAISLGTSAVNLSGEVLGMRVGARTTQATFVPGTVLKDFIMSYKQNTTETSTTE